MSFKRLFQFLALVTILFSGQELFSSFGTGPCRDHLCEIILNLSHRFETRCHPKIFSISRSVDHLILWNGAI